MATACSCNEPLVNTGLPGCVTIPDITQKLILVPLEDSAGAANSIDLTATLDQAYFDALISNSDDTKRFYPTPRVYSVESVRDAPVTEDIDGSPFFVKDSALPFVASFVRVPPDFTAKINEWRCQKNIGAFLLDGSGRIIGDKSTSGELRPLKINENTLYCNFVPATETTVAKGSLNFEFDDSVSDSIIGVINPSDLDDVNPLSFEGLIDLTVTEAAGTTDSSFTLVTATDYGSVVNPEGAPNLVAADWDVYNDTTMAAVSVTLTESPRGTYAFAFTAQTSGDELTVTLASGVTGYDWDGITITLP